MINFPSEGYEDSGEGGLFVMMVVPEPDYFPHQCVVDGRITISQVDVEVSRTGLWRPYSWNSEGNRKRRRVDDIIRKEDEDLFIWSTRLVNMDDASRSLLFAAHMGSTGESLVNAHGHFTATVDHLTPAGRALYDAVRAAYGIDPVLVTCLDT